MFVKITKSYRNVVAICDAELLGKCFEEQKFLLDIKESFYKGERMSKNEVKRIIDKMSAEDATFNIVGKNSINLAVECGIISPEGVKKIQGIPFALVLM